MSNRKAQSTGFAWVYGLIMIFGLGVMYIVFNQVFTAYLVPTIKSQVNMTQSYGQIDEATRVQIYAGIDKYMSFFHLMPFILFFVVVIYMIVAAIRKERENIME
jgi:hypothetical protein